MRSVDVLIVSYNTKDVLRDALRSVLGHPPPREVAELQVSVLDNASSDGSAAMVAEEFPTIRLIRSNVNLGFGKANNRLAQSSDADFLLLLNPDVLLREDLVAPLLAALDLDPASIAAGPRMIYPDGQVQFSAHRLPDLPYEFARVIRGTRLGRLVVPVFDSQSRIDKVHEVAVTQRGHGMRSAEFLWATCWMLRRADVAQAGLFDERFPMYDEDLDFCRRIRDRGRTLHYVPSVELVHLGGTSTATTLGKARLMQAARHRYYRRHDGRVTALVYSAGLLALQAAVRLVAIVPSARREQR